MCIVQTRSHVGDVCSGQMKLWFLDGSPKQKRVWRTNKHRVNYGLRRLTMEINMPGFVVPAIVVAIIVGLIAYGD